MSLLLPPIQPEKEAAVEEEDCERLEELGWRGGTTSQGGVPSPTKLFCVLTLTLCTIYYYKYL